MARLIVSYVVVLVVLAAAGALWLSWFARAMFRPTLGSILLDDPRWAAGHAVSGGTARRWFRAYRLRQWLRSKVRRSSTD
ncbi:MAG TPA: hypothetical protein VII49_11180 [Rhizomicrobium sp.]